MPRVYTDPPGSVAAEFLPNGNLLLAWGRVVYEYDPATRRTVRPVLRHQIESDNRWETIQFMVRLPDPGLIAVAIGYHGIIETYDEQTGELVACINPGSYGDVTYSLGASPGGGLLVASRLDSHGSGEDEVAIFDPLTMRILAQRVIPRLSQNTTPVFSSDSGRIFSAADDPIQLVEWNLETDELRTTPDGGWGDHVGQLSWGDDPWFVASRSSSSCSCRIDYDFWAYWCQCTYQRAFRVAKAGGQFFAPHSESGYTSCVTPVWNGPCSPESDYRPLCQLSPSGNFLLKDGVLFCSDDTTTISLDCRDGCESGELTFNLATFNGDESLVLYQVAESWRLGQFPVRRVYDTSTGALRYDLTPRERNVGPIRLNATGSRLYSIADGGLVNVWDTESGARLPDIRTGYEDTPVFNQFVLDPNERLLVVRYPGYSHPVVVVDMDGDNAPKVIYPYSGAEAMAFSRDGSRLAIMGFTSIQLFDTSSGRPSEVRERNSLTWPQYFETRFDAMAFGPDGATLTAAMRAGNPASLYELIVFDLKSGEPVRLRRLSNPVGSIEYSPDGRRILLQDKDQPAQLTILDTLTLKVVSRLVVSGRIARFDGSGELILAYGGSSFQPLDVIDWRTGLRILQEFPLDWENNWFQDVQMVAGTDAIYTQSPLAIARWKLPDPCGYGGTAPIRKVLGIDQTCDTKDLNGDNIIDSADFVAWTTAQP